MIEERLRVNKGDIYERRKVNFENVIETICSLKLDIHKVID